MTNGTGRLAGKVAIITGATATGPVMAKLFVSEGAKVLLAARREEVVQKAAREAGAIGMRADVTVEEDVRALVDRAMREFGQVDIMLNNAAASGTETDVWDQTLENWNATMAIGVTAAMLCTREVLKRSMLERRTGSIINFSSTAGWRPLPRMSHYATAKAALRTFTKAVALEAGPYGVRCNCLVPGIIDTEPYRGWVRRLADEAGVDYETMSARRVAAQALPIASTPTDVGNLAVFLASDESRTITGQSINCDGGGYMVG